MELKQLVDEAMRGIRRNQEHSHARRSIVAWGPRCTAIPVPGIRVVRACDEGNRNYLHEPDKPNPRWRWIGLYDAKSVTREQIQEDIECWWNEYMDSPLERRNV